MSIIKNRVRLGRTRLRVAQARELLEMGYVTPACVMMRIAVDTFSLEIFGRSSKEVNAASLLIHAVTNRHHRRTKARYKFLHEQVNGAVHGGGDPSRRVAKHYMKLLEVIGLRWLDLVQIEWEPRAESEVAA